MCCLGYEYDENDTAAGYKKAMEKVRETAKSEVTADDKSLDAFSPEIVCRPAIQTVQKEENLPVSSEKKDGQQKPEGAGVPKRKRRRRHRRRGPKKDE
jgi:hypothetical protein